MKKEHRIDSFINDQLSRWPLACGNFRALKNVIVKEMTINGLGVKVQFNPARIISSAARTDAASLNGRPCFLCPDHRPAEQIKKRFEGRKGKRYDILVNPYPIFPDHLVIALDRHSEQSIWKRYVDLLDLSKAYQQYVFFYNGPKCGASAPDHHHFQGAGKGLMPLESDVDMQIDIMDGKLSGEDCILEYLASVQDADLYHYDRFTSGVFVIRAETAKSSAKLFYRLLDCAPMPDGDREPRFNLFTYHTGEEYRTIVVFRSKHRSRHYFSEGPDHLTMSPGCADMAGVFITPVKEDFDKLDERLLAEMVSEVSLPPADQDMIISRLTRTQPMLEVGIMSGREIEFEILSDGAGARKAMLREGKIEYDGALYDELYFGENTLSTMFAEPAFVLYGVTIGKNFHWERAENQKFAGALKIIVEKDRLTAVNVIGVEDYLVSVISSEMKSTASLEFLKAHSVISRSWVMSRLARRCDRTVMDTPRIDNVPALVTYLDGFVIGRKDGTPSDEYIKWYDQEQHRNYDVCADDHCQRYQGLTRAAGDNVRKAVDQTWGEVLMEGMELCDARFSKCCGGVTERFSSCWDDTDFGYLPALPDTPGHQTGEKSFCDTVDREVLSQVLNGYDLETEDFFHWTVRYGREELSGLIERRSGMKIGLVEELVPLERGESGRIWKLKVKGSEGEFTVGKELEIRRILSDTHLKSSAFDIEYVNDACSGDGFTDIVLHGRGWGHGVGLCQIGAAVMSSRGYGYRQILSHYYQGAEISRL